MGIGFITWSLARQPQLLDLALEHRPAAVMLSFGDPRPFAEKVRRAGAKLLLQVQSIETLREALAARPDVVVAQGTEAGGHGGDRALFTLLPAVKALAGSIPVLAAGGIIDAPGFEAVRRLGAEGVLVGTRFIAADESLATPEAKQRLLRAQGDATLRTSVFDIIRGYDWPRQFTGRALRNRFSDAWHGNETSLMQRLPEEQPRYWRAAENRDYDTAVIFAGEAVERIDSVLPARAIVERICGG